MASVLPIFFLVAAGLCLSFVLLWLWQSLRFVLSRGETLPAASVPGHAGRVALLREKEELLRGIRDVRAEHELGKLSHSDFQEFEQRYRVRAREVLRQLEEQISPYRDDARKLLEQALAGTIPATPSEKSVQAEGACPQCQTRNDGDAVFCKKCGARLRAEVSA